MSTMISEYYDHFKDDDVDDGKVHFPMPPSSAIISVTKWELEDVILVESILIRASLLK